MVDFLARPAPYAVFVLIPLFFFAGAYAQTEHYAMQYTRLALEEPEYTSWVFGDSSFWWHVMARFLLLLLPFVVVHWLLGYLDLPPRRKKKSQPKGKKFFLVEALVRAARDSLWVFPSTVVVLAVTRRGHIVDALSIGILSVAAVLLFRILYILLSRLAPWGNASIAMARTAIVLPLSAAAAVVTMALTSKVTAPDLNTEVAKGMWENLRYLVVVYVIFVSFTTWVLSRYSQPNLRPPNPRPAGAGVPVGLSIAFAFLTVIVILVEINYRDSPVFAERTAKIFGGSVDFVARAREYMNGQIVWRSGVFLLIGVVGTTITASLVKVGAYCAICRKRT
ncbi:MAG: hypothetical protein NT025_06030 [bacterium]|nr:hypothetical protein [bacterium]